jgi:hypothetical protein
VAGATNDNLIHCGDQERYGRVQKGQLTCLCICLLSCAPQQPLLYVTAARRRCISPTCGADGNSPGLRVCSGCWDMKDPWRLPARKTETVAVRHPRPDEPLTVPEE